MSSHTTKTTASSGTRRGHGRPRPTTPARRGGATGDRGRGRQLVVVAGGLVVVAVIVLVAVLSAGERGSTPSVEELAGRPTIVGDAYPPAADDTAEDPALGQPAPVVQGADFDGEPVTIGGGGRPQLIMFLAAWCPACQEELPRVVAWQEAGGVPVDIQLVAVSTGLDQARPGWPPTEWFEEEGYTGTILVDDADGDVADAYGLAGTPYWVALDEDGDAVWRRTGMVEPDELDMVVERLTTG